MLWPELEELLSVTFNVHPSNLHIQYQLSTKQKGALPANLTSQRQLDMLLNFIRPQRGNSKKVIVNVTTRYGLPHYAYMIHWTCYFSFYLPCLSLTLCLIHTDNFIPLYDTTPLPLCPGPCSTYDAAFIFSIAMPLFINMYASLYIQVYIPCTS